MSQNPLMHSGNQFSRTPSLKPALSAALASLEVQLDRELARYRRYRGTSRTSNQVQPANFTGSQLQYSIPTNINVNNNIAKATTDSVVGSERQEIPVSPINNSNLPPTYVTEIPTPPPPPPSQIPRVGTSGVTATEANTPQTSSIVPTAKPKTKSDSSNNSNFGVPPTSQPDDYLESSEALLRSLTEEAPKEQKQPKANKNSLLSPLGIGSILLLLTASLILAYAIINPKGLPFRFDGLFKRNNPASENSLTDGDKGQTSAGNVEVAPVPKYPNLAREEFPEVKNPNDVVGLKPKSSSTPIATNPPEVQNQIPQNQIPQNQIPTQQLPQQAVPIAPTTINPPSPSPVPTKEVPISEIKPSADGFYHLVIDNNNPNALANARKAVPDAYISDDKKLILLGAMKDKNGAEQLLNEVKAKGINARVRQP
ncbi:hypothetical protein [Brunnivagina elsteri]|uniref:SPOR domain-containing protein n=1 Tax=Brunnivagina elsteri CCALA 953 TaxID=987040 RepID=A0A2A2THU3_9CYAN|nr:hypothetical protein [Calothrix elsteri]PAX53367.1 hypothetical protein CK510_14410 [Calothrix elsteri CCALA 953]